MKTIYGISGQEEKLANDELINKSIGNSNDLEIVKGITKTLRDNTNLSFGDISQITKKVLHEINEIN